MKLKKWKTISSKKCCGNEWISVREDRVRLPTSELLESYIVIDYCGAVGVLAIQENKILLIKQYRYAIDRFTLEIPAGSLVGKGVANIKKSAEAELLEESGYRAKIIEPFYRYHPSPGSSNEVIYLTRALGIEKSTDVLGFDVNWYDIKKVHQMIMEGAITHSPTVISVLLGQELGFFDIKEE